MARPSTAALTINLAVYAKAQGGSVSLLRCVTLADLAADGTFSALTIPDAGGGNLAYVVDSLQDDGFHGQIDAPGEYLVRVHPDSCDAAGLPLAHQVRISVNPARSFVIRLHYRDHLGSTTHLKTYAPSFAEGVPGQTIALDLSEGRLTLYPQWTEAMYYEPFGTPIAATDVEGRYTDHEYDQATGLHYMKGRFQDPQTTKFTRPDPLRDWDLTMPYTLNLYEYVSNDPVNLWDPFGLFGENEVEEVLRATVGQRQYIRELMIHNNGRKYGAHILRDQITKEIGTTDIAMGSSYRGGIFPLIWEGGKITRETLVTTLSMNLIGAVHGHLFQTAKTIDPEVNPVFGTNIPHSNTDLISGSYQVPKGFVTIITSDDRDYVTESIEPEKGSNLFTEFQIRSGEAKEIVLQKVIAYARKYIKAKPGAIGPDAILFGIAKTAEELGLKFYVTVNEERTEVNSVDTKIETKENEKQ